jgi:TetR/AcrR family transcriptional regulator
MRKNEKLSLENLIKEQDLYDNPLTEKQKDILLAAEKLFSEFGYSDTPTAEIAKKAGVTERTLFKHFPAKADLFRRVMFPLILRFVVPTQIKHLKALIQNAGDNPEDIFKAILKDRLQLVSRYHGRMKFVVIELLKNDEMREQIFKIWHKELWSEVIQQIDVMQKEGKVRKDVKSSTIARTMVSMIFTYVFTSQLAPKQENHDENIDELAKIFVKGILP